MSPSVTPVALKKQFSPLTRSSWVITLVTSYPASSAFCALLVALRPQAADHPAAVALQRGGGDHALGRAADPPQQVHGPVGRGRQQRAGDVAVGDQPHARARLADRLDALLVARAVEHDDHHVAHLDAAALGDQLDGLAERAVEVQQVDQAVAGRPSSPCRRPGRGRTSCRARRARSRRPRSAGPGRSGGCRRAGRRRCRRAAACRRRRPRRWPASAPRPSRPRRSRPRRPCGSCAARRACRPPPPGRRPPCRPCRRSGRPAARRPRSRARARARGCGPAACRRVGVLIGLLEACVVVRCRSRASRRRRRSGREPSSATNQPTSSEIWLDGVAGPVDEADVEHEHERDHPHHRGHLPARPRELVVAQDHPGEDQRRDRRGEQQPAQDRERLPAPNGAADAVDRSRCDCPGWSRTRAGTHRARAAGRRARRGIPRVRGG